MLYFFLQWYRYKKNSKHNPSTLDEEGIQYLKYFALVLVIHIGYRSREGVQSFIYGTGFFSVTE